MEKRPRANEHCACCERSRRERDEYLVLLEQLTTPVPDSKIFLALDELRREKELGIASGKSGQVANWGGWLEAVKKALRFDSSKVEEVLERRRRRELAEAQKVLQAAAALPANKPFFDPKKEDAELARKVAAARREKTDGHLG